jgi:hypothetical protein|tara:strand:+ start:13330 stop:13539 length:210 start_codon:yes stop_codon:yes gene_type:complete
MEGGKMTNLQVLMLIGAFITLTFGSFLWFIITWDAKAEESISSLQTKPALAFSPILPPEVPHAYTRVTL